jgi:hypothetical protein
MKFWIEGRPPYTAGSHCRTDWPEGSIGCLFAEEEEGPNGASVYEMHLCPVGAENQGITLDEAGWAAVRAAVEELAPREGEVFQVQLEEI